MTKFNFVKQGATIALGALALTGCVTNPVTGKSELAIVSAAQEVQIGVQNYAPMQQSQGGRYVMDPELNRYVESVGRRLANASPRALPYEFVVLNNSVPNAWALPGGKIAVNRGLLVEMKSEAELAAVLGHEVVHAAAKHSARQMQRGMLLQTIVLGTAIATNDSDYGSLATTAANFGAQFLSQSYSRNAELESDYYGMQYMQKAGYDPQGAVGLQETFLRLAAQSGRESSYSIFSSHPPTQQRLATNTITASELPAGGVTGDREFQRAMQKTRDARPAYDAYDEGRKALAEKNLSLAASKAKQAIQLEPREGHFHALLGDIALVQNKYADAISRYDDALRQNREFFYYHLQRGIAGEKSGNDAQATRDLETSLQLLPTGVAYYSLGNIAQRQRNTAKALEYYRAAANSPGETGQAAQVAVLRIDLTQNPGQYVQMRSGTDANGQLLIALNNPNPVALTDLAVQIRYVDSNGATNAIERSLTGTLAAGANTTIASGLGPFTANNQFEVKVSRASIAE